MIISCGSIPNQPADGIKNGNETGVDLRDCTPCYEVGGQGQTNGIIIYDKGIIQTAGDILKWRRKMIQIQLVSYLIHLQRP